MEKISIGQIINMNSIRYDRMTKMVTAAFAGSRANKVNIYIDLFSILKTLYRNLNYVIDDYSVVTSCIINMCAHYRSFFEERYKVESEIFLIFSTNTCEINKSLVGGYNSKNELMLMSNPKVTDMITSNLKLLEVLCPYLPDIYFIKLEFETSVVIKYLIDKKNTGENIIITKDIYSYQLVSDLSNRATIFRPSKSNINGTMVDDSYFINYYNVMDIFAMERKTNTNKSNMLPYTQHLSLIMALSRLPERNIKSLLNISTVMNLLSTMMSNHYIDVFKVNDINSVYDYIIKNTKADIHGQLFFNRYKAIDIDAQLSILLNNSSSCLIIDKALINLYDPVAVREINDKYFKSYPLDLNRL